LLFADRLPETGDPAARDLEFQRITRSANPYSDKIASIVSAPFERTLYLDTDTYVLGNPNHLFDLLDRYDIAAAHAPGYRFSADPEVPPAFFELNTGVLAWRNTPRVAEFLRNWLSTYQAWVAAPPFPGAGVVGDVADQPAFRRCLWQSGLSLYVIGPEYNYRTLFAGSLVDRAVIIHGRHRDPERVGAVLNKQLGPRNFTKFAPSLFDRAERKINQLRGKGR
jgi:hypothetical protein